MYCPKCGVRNLDDARYCRGCGADVSLVRQALAGHAPQGAAEAGGREIAGPGGRKRRLKEPPTLEKGLENVFGGVALLVIFLLGFFYFLGGFMMWVWFIIPALAYMGKGIGQVIRSRAGPHTLPRAEAFAGAPLMPDPARRAALPPPDTSEIIRPAASVTEGTTRDLFARPERGARDA